MRILAFEKIARTEQAAERYLLDSCIKAKSLACPLCRAEKLYTIEGGARRRCARCGRSFHPWSGRWIGKVNIQARKWLWIVKLFDLEIPATRISEETGVSYPTTLKALDVIRRSIAAIASGDAVRAPTPGAESIMSSIETRAGAVIYEAVAKKAVRCIMRMAGGYLVGVDRTMASTSLHYRGEKMPVVDKGDKFPFWRVYCSGEPGVWQYVKEGLAKHHGVSDAKLMLYIQEMEFRFMNRRRELFALLVARLCGPAAPAAGRFALISR